MKKKLTKKQWWLAATGLVFVLLIGVIVNFVTQPKNLGSKLEYIGKKNVGCEWWQVPLYLGWCQGPSYDYYYATDMSQQEVEAYFKKMDFTYESGTGGADYEYRDLGFEVNSDPQSAFEVGYFDEQNSQKIMKIYNLKTNRKHIVLITDYAAAKSAFGQ